MGGIEAQRVLGVGEQQLLVLLLVVQPERDERLQARVVGTGRDDGLHALVDLRAVGQHTGERGPVDQAALQARVLLAHALVVAVEQHPKSRVEGHETRLEALQHEGLEEPGDVREVPFRRARIGHGLHLAQRLRQRRSECDRLRANRREALSQQPARLQLRGGCRGPQRHDAGASVASSALRSSNTKQSPSKCAPPAS